MTGEHLVLLRILGALTGSAFMLWSFVRFRMHLIPRRDFLLMVLFGASLTAVSLAPDSINMLAEMLSMEDKQFGRILSLLILSNFILWFLLFGLRGGVTRTVTQMDLLIRSVAVERFFKEHGTEAVKNLTVVIPVYNEAGNLRELLPRMPRTVEGMDVGCLVVDDGSDDDTVRAVEENGFPVAANPFNRGGGAALRLGFDLATAAGAEIVVAMDGDGQHRPEELHRLVEPILKGEADFVIGSRVLGKHERDSLVRWVGIHFFNVIINLLSGVKVTDCSSGYRAVKVEALKKVLLLQDQFHTAEFIIDAAKKGLRIREVPVTICRRLSGSTKKGRNFSYGLNFSRTILKTWLRK